MDYLKRYTIAAKLIEQGYIIHGTNYEFDKFDEDYIVGGSRAREGYGFYFTDMPYKAIDYGKYLKVVKKDVFNFLNSSDAIDFSLFEVFGVRDEYDRLNQLLFNSENFMESYYKLEELRERITEYEKIFGGGFIYFIDDAIKHGAKTYGQLEYFVRNPDKNVPIIHEIYKSKGFDGYETDGIYTIFNFDKLNQYVLSNEDTTKLIQSFINEGVVKINEKQLKEIVSGTVKEMLSEGVGDRGYVEDDLIAYARLGINKTGLPVEIYVDDGTASKMFGHDIFVYVRDGYSNYDDVVPVVLDENPYIYELYDAYYGGFKNISQSEVRRVFDYISMNYNLLLNFANRNVKHLDFYKLLKRPISVYSKNINELATLYSEDSGLPVDLWIDEGTSPQHGPRIKFRASSEQKTTRQFSTMTISEFPEIFNFPKKYDIKSKDIEKIKQFVKNNRESLIKLAKNEINYDDFIEALNTGPITMIVPKNIKPPKI